MATAVSTLITRVLDNVSRASTGTTRSGTTLANKGMDWANDTQLAVSRKHDFSDTIQLSSGVGGTSITVGVSITDLLIGAADNTTVTSTLSPFTATDANNLLQVTSGTGFTAGWYTVSTVAGVIATLNTAVGTVAASSGSALHTDMAYSFPTGWKNIIDIRIIYGNDSRRLKMVPRSRMDTIVPYPQNDTPRIPRFYIPYGGAFDVYPIPDSAYVMPIRYFKWPTTITATTDTIFYDAHMDDIIVAGMTARAFRYIQMFEDGKLWELDFNEQLQRAIEDDGSIPDWDPVGRGFSPSGDESYIGEYWLDPFTMKSL